MSEQTNKPLEEIPNEITICNLEVIVMPNGEILFLGKTVDWFQNAKKYLTIKE